ncbi:hypothetical protein COV42_02185 [Candidatus Campbellbacteria bacterium CG11_big_fil_rev_8_21_14_0_20_44_21]|nr:MAG: hypothetical protein COV42_02185 [Candidatus Campbellbacteria bacterium CG11_big_fil_rev_8_21_14_0_20_44_21]
MFLAVEPPKTQFTTYLSSIPARLLFLPDFARPRFESLPERERLDLQRFAPEFKLFTDQL